MWGQKFGERLDTLKLTCPYGDDASAPAPAPKSPAIISAKLATMARGRLRLPDIDPAPDVTNRLAALSAVP